MKTPRTRISRAVTDKTLQIGVSKRLGKEIAAYLLAERRTSELDSVLRDVQANWAAVGHVEVLASSAFPLTAAIRAEIQRQAKKLYPTAKRIVVTESCDPAVIGGVRLSLPNRQLDLSVKAKLNKFKQLTTAERIN